MNISLPISNINSKLQSNLKSNYVSEILHCLILYFLIRIFATMRWMKIAKKLLIQIRTTYLHYISVILKIDNGKNELAIGERRAV